MFICRTLRGVRTPSKARPDGCTRTGWFVLVFAKDSSWITTRSLWTIDVWIYGDSVLNPLSENMKIEKPTILLKSNHYIKCFCFIQNVANKNTNTSDLESESWVLQAKYVFLCWSSPPMCLSITSLRALACPSCARKSPNAPTRGPHTTKHAPHIPICCRPMLLFLGLLSEVLVMIFLFCLDPYLCFSFNFLLVVVIISLCGFGKDWGTFRGSCPFMCLLVVMCLIYHVKRP